MKTLVKTFVGSGTYDAAGNEIGYIVKTWTMTHVVVQKGASKNGEFFFTGSLQPARKFMTIEGAKAWALKTVSARLARLK